MAVVVHAARWQDHDGACFLLQQLRAFGRLRVIFADSAYRRNGLPDWLRTTFGWVLQVVLRSVAARGFVLLPKRWVVERTFAWLKQYRRHSKDYERNPETSEAMIYISMIVLGDSTVIVIQSRIVSGNSRTCEQRSGGNRRVWIGRAVVRRMNRHAPVGLVPPAD